MDLTLTKRGRVRWYVKDDDGLAVCGGTPSYDDEAEALQAAVRSHQLLTTETPEARPPAEMPLRFWG